MNFVLGFETWSVTSRFEFEFDRESGPVGNFFFLRTLSITCTVLHFELGNGKIGGLKYGLQIKVSS